ncbi:7-carboxy-7-deazaguanine synthase QueE [Catellatospora citrea]|uniref:7-carboxy-7-deazaguanine synthase n=1 Tax=Catellatospora citrea TaxID=53366 RepID=A0A8J3KRZ9_9ACTN|nr:7-carboxy-7-deazaguanine synthase QueE [Catellatospora citrea]RKE07899.1 organic radical activating enzyme [Catellatospora citrea]GIG02091.1 radical SAM protein [Catellatospora citrea]
MTALLAAMPHRPLLVSEIFGPTVQGEGPSTGRQALFIRLSRCNLTCGRCDTPYTWDWSRFDAAEQTQKISGEELVAWALGHPTRLVVISGGEPLIQQQLLDPVVRALAAAGREVEIETNGTFAPTTAVAGAVTAFNVSPKLASFAPSDDEPRRIVGAALKALEATGKARFKFVVSDPADLQEVASLQREFGLTEIWIMPEGAKPEQVIARTRQIADEVIERGWNLSTRLHVLVWGDTRGR